MPTATDVKTVVATYLSRHKRANTRRTYEHTLDTLIAVIGGDTSLSDITEDDLDRYEDHLYQAGLAAATIASRKKRVKAFFNWCVERELLPRSPARNLKVKHQRINQSSKALSPDVRTAMFAAVQAKREELPRVRDTAILALLMTYGARSIDLARLTVRRVNLVQGWIHFDRKGHSEDRQPTPTDTRGILAAWIEYRNHLIIEPDHDFLFVNVRTSIGARHQPLRAASIQTMFKRLALEVSGSMYGPHSMRHLRAQELLDAGFPREVVALILGHSSIDTLRHYANQDWKRHLRALEATELGRTPPPLAGEAPPSSGKVISLPPDYFTRRVSG